MPYVVCDNDNVCDGAESCDPSAGCRAGTPLVCDDSDPCTVDTCDPASGCRSTELPGLDFVSCALEQHLAPLLPSAAAPGRAAKTAHKLAAQLGSAERFDFEQTSIGLRLTLPNGGASEPDRVIVLRTVKSPP